MPEFMDLTGQRFGRLVVLRRGNDYISPKGAHHVKWVCRGDCGNVKEIAAAHLRSGDNLSCGCFWKERIAEKARVNSKTHGLSNTRIYKEFRNINDRCYNPNNPSYANYGGRGISVCDEWRGIGNFLNFYNWSMANGYKDDLTIDRVDVNGNYEPGNCRWVDWETQYNNTTKTVKLTFNGETMSVAQWARKLGFDRHTLYSRIKIGLPIEEVLSPKRRVGGRYANSKKER